MKTYKILSIFSIILLVSCQVDFSTNNTVPDGKYLTVSIEKTRTSLGDKKENSYPVYWSADDQIVVNGELSGKAQIDSDNEGKASFLLSDNAEYPYLVTYPHCTSTTATAPVVEFVAEQSYTEGSFSTNCAPMCGYAEKGQSVALKHLATILRLPVKSVAEGVTLEKVVVTSSVAKLAGEFSVDCQNGTITPKDEATNSVTYTVNQTLSTSTETVLYISLPAVDAGSCTLEFIDSKGGKMSGNWSAGTLNGGVVKEFECIEYSTGKTLTLEPLSSMEGILNRPNFVAGYVRDCNGNPIEGIAVSDGFSVVRTDTNGRYQMDSVSIHTWYVQISIPAEYEIPINEYGQPCFYKKYDKDNSRYDFTLTPLAGGKEDKFALFAMADPQVSSDTGLTRFYTESIPQIKKHVNEVAATGIPCYGITLGDIIGNSSSNYDEPYRPYMRDGLTVSRMSMPIFHVMGNHDNTFYKSSQQLLDSNGQPFEKADTLAFQMAAQRAHEDMFGPVNYSFERGNMHIVAMRNIIYNSVTSPSINENFSKEQIEWLKQDLEGLSRSDKGLVLCVHAPLFSNLGYEEVKTVLSLIREFEHVHILSGHIHTQRNYTHSNGIYEHNVSAVCGSWWQANIARDGSPNGYQVFIGDNNDFSDWYYIGINEGMNTREHQMRLHWGDAVTGAEISGTNSNGTKGYYQFNFGANTLVANIYNVDSAWRVEVYEDGEYSGEMTKVTTSVSYSNLIGSYTLEDPKRTDGTDSQCCMYTTGLFLGILGYDTNVYRSSNHMYKYTLKNPKGRSNVKDIQIMVKAYDYFDREYTETTITGGTDYTLTKTR